MKIDEEIISEALKMGNISTDIRVNLLLCKNALKIQREECIKEITDLEIKIFNGAYTKEGIMHLIKELIQKLSEVKK